MTRPVHPQQLVVRVDDTPTEMDGPVGATASVELVDTQAGPAGTSLVELANGTVCEVDHADPAQLVQLTVAVSPLPDSLAPWIGAQRALDVLGLARSSDATDRDDDSAARILSAAAPETIDGREPAISRRRRGARGAATAVGRLVVAADLLDDPTADNFVRLIAGVEVLLELDDDPDVQLLDSVRDDVGDSVTLLATAVDDGILRVLIELDAEPVRRASWALRSLAERSDEPVLPLERLLASLDDWLRQHDVSRFAGAPRGAVHKLLDMPMSAPILASDEIVRERQTPEDFRQVERLEPALLRVTVSRAVPGSWVRVLRAQGFVLLAAAPLLEDGLLMSADVVVPPDTTDDELVVQVVDSDRVDLGPRPAELIRRAIAAGREAARAERLGRADLIASRWLACAELWDLAGDSHRATLARLRADADRPIDTVVELVCDELAEQLHSLDI